MLPIIFVNSILIATFTAILNRSLRENFNFLKYTLYQLTTIYSTQNGIKRVSQCFKRKEQEI